MSLVPNLNVEKSWLGALTIIEQVITQVIERVGQKSLGYKLVHIPETDSAMEFKQLPPTPHMSPIIRPKTKPIKSIPSFPLSETKLSVVLDKTKTSFWNC